MRRLLKLQTWTLRGTTAADASFVLLAATIIVPAVLFIGASWLAYGETQRQYEERLGRTLDLLYGHLEEWACHRPAVHGTGRFVGSARLGQRHQRLFAS